MAKDGKGKKWLNVLKRVAPTLATALGGPLAGAAAQAISMAITGRADTPEEQLEELINSGDYETLLKLKVADNEFKLKMEELGLKREELALRKDEMVYDDMDSARKRHMDVKDKEPARLAYMAMLVFAILVAMVITRSEMFEQSQFATVIVSTIIGAAISWVDKAYNFFLGSSKGSSDKTKAMTDAMERRAGTDAMERRDKD
jgi:hypothetical protein